MVNTKKQTQKISVVHKKQSNKVLPDHQPSKMGARLSDMLKEIELALCLTSNVATSEIEKIEGELENLLILTKQYKIKRLIQEL